MPILPRPVWIRWFEGNDYGIVLASPVAVRHRHVYQHTNLVFPIRSGYSQVERQTAVSDSGDSCFVLLESSIFKSQVAEVTARLVGGIRSSDNSYKVIREVSGSEDT